MKVVWMHWVKINVTSPAPGNTTEMLSCACGWPDPLMSSHGTLIMGDGGATGFQSCCSNQGGRWEDSAWPTTAPAAMSQGTALPRARFPCQTSGFGISSFLIYQGEVCCGSEMKKKLLEDSARFLSCKPVKFCGKSVPEWRLNSKTWVESASAFRSNLSCLWRTKAIFGSLM